MSLQGSCNSEKIYNFLVKAGYTPAGACGILANLDRESGLLPNNLENTYNAKYGSDSYYTNSVNNKTYSKDSFVNDGAGYGVAQWTFPTRKRGLYEHTVERGISIDNLEAQLEYLVKELTQMFKSLDTFLRTTDNYNVACDKFLTQFENPLIPNYSDRRAVAKKYYNKYSSLKVDNGGNAQSTNDNTKKEYPTYTIQPGDSWWGISCKLFGTGTRMNEIAELNNKSTSDIIHPNQVIKVPTDAKITTSNNSGYTIYIAKRRDTWKKIAREKLGDSNKATYLAAFNDKTIRHPIVYDAKIKIPNK